MKPSKYQQAIIDWIRFGTGNTCINAVAGAGKTATLRMVAQALSDDGLNPSDIKIVVFGKANATQMTKSFGPRWAKSISTLHSTGLMMLRSYWNNQSSRCFVESQKYRNISEELGLIEKRTVTRKLHGVIKTPADFIKLIDFTRLTNSTPSEDSIKNICDHFEIDLEDSVYACKEVVKALNDVLEQGENLGRERRLIDFTDMIWLPVRWNLKNTGVLKAYKFILVDECQDLNPIQLELSLGLAGTNGRMLFVGDPRQAIMGFAGADDNSYQTILQRSNSTELPLSVCYRCPTSHIQLVNQIFPKIAIEPAPGAKKGSITTILESELEATKLTNKDLIISRKTAPLVTLCIKLIAAGVPATVKGRSLGESLDKILK